MTDVEFSLVEPASLCRAAGEDLNLGVLVQQQRLNFK
jgi:hypothetical protein